MDIRRKILLLSLFAFLFPTSHAQMAMGAWKTHFSYNNVIEIAESAKKVYAISNGSLFSVDKEYESIETYSKINGLSDGEIAHIAYSKENNLLFIAYANGNIDLLKENNISNISDLKRKEIFDKEINNIFFYKHYAYLSCGFGIVVVDLKKNEIADTYIIWDKGIYLKINNVQIAGNHIYALTKNGIYYADTQNHNLSNFENWTLLSNPDASAENKDIAAFNDELMLLKDNAIYRYNGQAWNVFIEGASLSHINVSGENITFFRQDIFVRIGKNWQWEEVKEFSWITNLIFSPSENCYWIAQYNMEEGQITLIKYKNGEIENRFIPEGPYSNTAAFIKHRYGKLITGSGGPYDFSPFTPGIVQIYENGKWTTIRNKDIPAGVVDYFVDVLDVEINPRNHDQIYVATWSKSLFLFENNKLISHFTSENSALSPNSTSNYSISLDGLNFDKDNNLWMVNMKSLDVLKVRKADNTWASLHYPTILNREAGKLFISKNGYKWLFFQSTPDLFVINDRGTPFNTSDDQTRLFNSRSKFQENSGGEITVVSPQTFRCMVEDKNNAIWIGTDMGPLIISNPENIFNDNFTVDRIKITREDNENLADYLLETELINDIAVDGGNRKWIATGSSGVFLLSPDGQETIHHFTTENSPLTSNAITSLAIDDKTGEVFIATSSALYSFKSDAMEGAPSYSDVYAYPNPVRPGYTGMITITGLMERSVVKIADVQGNLIFQGNSNGGVIAWDGKNRKGQRVGSGVYLVFAALPDGSEKMVTKIAIVN